MHRNIEDISGIEISSGVIERVLMTKEEGDKEKMCSVHHYTLFDGGELTIENPLTEYQHYIISGRTENATADTAIFSPAGNHYPKKQAQGLRTQKINHVGEGETRIFTVAHQVPRPAFRWAKSRKRHLFQVPSTHQTSISATQIFTEEEHAIMGALRFHAIDIQTHPPGQHKGTINEKGEYIGHRNPAELMYFLRGTGKAMAENVLYDVKPGSFLYTREGTLHGIWNTTNDILEYIVMELIEHDKSWTERGYQGETNRPAWTKE